MNKRRIFAISGSTRSNASNSKILRLIADLTRDQYEMTLFEGIDTLPHFNPDLDKEPLPVNIAALRKEVADADAVIICTPEYVFSLPGSLKNALEWFVSTTLFSGKPVGLITASASGEKGQEELKLVMKTIQSVFSEDTTLLIQGVKGKFDAAGELTDPVTLERIHCFIRAFDRQLQEHLSATQS